MSYAYEHESPVLVAEAAETERAAFMRRTYMHLAGAILAFVGLEALFLSLPGINEVMMQFFGMGRFAWLVVLGLFMVASWIADVWARSEVSTSTQYAGLGLFVFAEALIFLPLLWIASTFFEGVILQAAILTLSIFAGLTIATLVTRRDFSFLRSVLAIGGMVAFGLILASIFFGFTLGLWFSLAMVAFACAAILYHTSQIQHHYRTDQHVAAALSLFASVALLFWYILQLVMRASRD